MFHYGLMWARTNQKAKPVSINKFEGPSNNYYNYHELDQNGNILPPLSVLQPIIDEIQNALGINMANYDSVIGNLYLDDQYVYPHKDTTESVTARNYPVIVYTIGNNSGLGIVDNNNGKMTFANNYNTLSLPSGDQLTGYTNEVLTKNGSIYTFGMNGKGRFELTHSTPTNSKKTQEFPPITLPNGEVVTNYTITLTFRRAQDLEPGMATEPAQLASQENLTTKTITYKPIGKTEQTYTIVGARIFNKDGKEVFAGEGKDRNRIFANLAVKEGRAVVVEWKDKKYVVNRKGQIVSVTTGDIMKWGEENGDRKGVVALANEKFASKGQAVESTTPTVSAIQKFLDEQFDNYLPQIQKIRGYKNIETKEDFLALPQEKQDSLIKKLCKS